MRDSQVPARPGAGLTFCDVSTFYCARGGGITTYHRAKIDWFARQRDHRYLLIAPGRRYCVDRLADTVTLVDVPGAPTGHGRDGYRLMLDYWRVRDVLAAWSPEVIEASDPWVSGPFALTARHHGHVQSLVTSFYHTDSLDAYLRPWLARSPIPRAWRLRVDGWAHRTFWRVQRLYDATLVASRAMKCRVEAEGVRRVVQTPFGVEPRFFGDGRRPTGGVPVRLLYAGRLQKEKSVDVLLAALPALLADEGVHVTIAGNGPLADDVARLDHPRVSWAGYITDRQALVDLYRHHDILLATSATETFGIATLEAMATGIVVVGADAGGIGDLMAQIGSGFAFRARDAADFVRAARAAMAADRADASARSRAVADGYGTWADAIARQTRAYEGLVAARRAPRAARPRPEAGRVGTAAVLTETQHACDAAATPAH